MLRHLLRLYIINYKDDREFYIGKSTMFTCIDHIKPDSIVGLRTETNPHILCKRITGRVTGTVVALSIHMSGSDYIILSCILVED